MAAQYKLQTNQSHNKSKIFVFVHKNTQNAQLSSFPCSSRSLPVTNPAACSLQVTPESPVLHDLNVLSQHTNPQVLSPSAGPTPARPHLDILLSRRFLGACMLCAFYAFCAFVLLCSVLPVLRAFLFSVLLCVLLCMLAFCARVFVFSKSAFGLCRH